MPRYLLYALTLSVAVVATSSLEAKTLKLGSNRDAVVVHDVPTPMIGFAARPGFSFGFMPFVRSFSTNREHREDPGLGFVLRYELDEVPTYAKPNQDRELSPYDGPNFHDFPQNEPGFDFPELVEPELGSSFGGGDSGFGLGGGSGGGSGVQLDHFKFELLEEDK